MQRPDPALTAAYDVLPVALMLAERDGSGQWQLVYENPAAQSLPDRSALLAALSGALDGTMDGRDMGRQTVELDGRRLTSRLAPREDGLAVVVTRDETQELLRFQEQLEAASAALRSALDAANAANQAKSDFLSHMSHDIRTPLNAIIGMTTIARTHVADTGRVGDCLEKIDLSSRHLLGLINDILDMSRIESGKMTLSPEEFTMADLIHGLMAVFQPQADKKRQKVDLDFTGIRCEHIRGDQLRIQQVLINILSNAVKFTPEEGEISLRVRETGERYGNTGTYAYYEFTVQDTGIGMSPEFLARIYQPFERADGVSRIEGTGLGMAITRNLVEMMNGSIHISSKEGAGSRFTVTLPLEQLDQPEIGSQVLHGLRILAADESGSLEHLQEIAQDLGLECDACDSTVAAMELAAQAHMEGRDYFAILLAWRMPVVDGVKACQELRAMLGGEIPIILTSSYEWALSDDEMRKYGISAFVSKPLFRSRLAETLLSFTAAGSQAGAADGGGDDFSGKRILLAEDNEINREIAVELIGMQGAQVECAVNGREAVELFSASGPNYYDLIFMDLQMPVMDGLAATRAIRALPRTDSRSVPIVAMTANAFVEDIQSCRKAGMDGHLAKPISLQQLTDVLRHWLG